jgi:hypothetical protein
MASCVFRRDDVLSEDVGDEVVVIDASINQAHALDADASRVWRAIDGQRDLRALSTHCGLSEAVVEDVIAQLIELDLLKPARGLVSRRVALSRLAIAGGGAVAAPLITSIALPSLAAAASTVFTGSPTKTGSGNPYPSTAGSTISIYTVAFTTTKANQTVILTGSPVLEFSQTNPGDFKAPYATISINNAVVATSETYAGDGYNDATSGNQYSWSLGNPPYNPSVTVAGNAEENDNVAAVSTTVATAGNYTAVVAIHDGSTATSTGAPGDNFYVNQGKLTITPQ